MANGLDIVRRVLERLKKPDDAALPYQTVLRTVGEKIAQRHLDLLLSEQNYLVKMSDWFTPPSADFPLNQALASLSNVLLPVRVETLPVDSERETGNELRIVGYQALNESGGAVAFYGTPLRMVFRDSLEAVQNRKIRIAYEPDIYQVKDAETNLSRKVGLPDFFSGMIALEAALDLLDEVDDDAPEWLAFVQRVNPKWVMMIADQRRQWEKYVKTIRGKVEVPKRTFFQNEARRSGHRTRFFKGDY